jgi:hypothetical protein
MTTRRAVMIGAASLLAGRASASQVRPVVAELFTSQGCSSCPPADALLRELSGRAEILPLAFHVTYWNSLGWKDPYSLDLATARQRQYAALMGTRTVYTPQLVVDGRIDAVGSDRGDVAAALKRAMAEQAGGPALTLATADGEARIDIDAGTGSGRVLLVGYDPEHQTKVGRGENAGRFLTEANIVRGLVDIGAWHGNALTLRAKLPEGQKHAVLVQDPRGVYLAAARAAPGV